MHWKYTTLLLVCLLSSKVLCEDTFCRYPNLEELQEPRHLYSGSRAIKDEFNNNCLIIPDYNASIQSSTLNIRDCSSPQYLINNDPAATWQPYTSPVPLTNGQSVFVKCADSAPLLLVNPPQFEENLNKGIASTNPSVFVVMVDSASMEVINRLMPNTVKMLQNEDDVDVFKFTKFATVGLNSNPNKFALFGRHVYDRESNPPNLPWIWEHAKKLGYTTAIAEDGCPSRSDAIWYPMRIPTHLNKINPELAPDYVMLSQICVEDPNPNKYCIKGRWGFEYVADYVSGMVDNLGKHSEKPIFMWSNFVDAHEPDQWALPLMDDIVVNYLQNIIQSKFMQNGVIVFLSDHGIHFGDYAYSSSLGAAENKHPFMYVLSTKGLLNKDIVTKNQDKLVTMNDVYRSMASLIGHKEEFNPHDVDIFNEHVSNDRTCEMAGVPSTYCLCLHGPASCAPQFSPSLWQICVSRFAHPKFYNYKYYNSVHLNPAFGRDFSECEALNHWCAYGVAEGWNGTSTDSLRAYVARTPALKDNAYCWSWPTDCNWGVVADHYFNIGFVSDK